MRLSRVDRWQRYFSTLLAAAAIAATLQYLQRKTANDKLKLELFERRLRVYEAVRKPARPSHAELYKRDHISEAAGAIADAKWLFDSEVQTFLRKVLERLYEVDEAIGRFSDQENDETRRMLKESRCRAFVWAIQNIGRLDQLLEPYLRI